MSQEELNNENFLAFWVECQKEDYRLGLLTKRQIKKLESLPNWSWD